MFKHDVINYTISKGKNGGINVHHQEMHDQDVYLDTTNYYSLDEPLFLLYQFKPLDLTKVEGLTLNGKTLYLQPKFKLTFDCFNGSSKKDLTEAGFITINDVVKQNNQKVMNLFQKI